MQTTKKTFPTNMTKYSYIWNNFSITQRVNCVICN